MQRQNAKPIVNAITKFSADRSRTIAAAKARTEAAAKAVALAKRATERAQTAQLVGAVLAGRGADDILKIAAFSATKAPGLADVLRARLGKRGQP